ncbi:MAG: hypothetical protein OXF50_15255 [Caldilineaceae bacterium]|nr:hypothetical protein [Caldilineaceae bacterium]
MTQLFFMRSGGQVSAIWGQAKDWLPLFAAIGEEMCSYEEPDESLWSGSVFGEQALLQFFPEDFTASPRGADADQPPEDQDGRDQRY